MSQSSTLVAGVDEAGRGPLAGPVVAAAVILPPDCAITGLADSKQLSARRRTALAAQIRGAALTWAVAEASVAEIDTLNILQATLLAMQRAVNALAPLPAKVLVDGNKAPVLPMDVRTIVGGDALVPAISAASILAKVERDRQMTCFDTNFPGYGFARHKGYGTKAHLAALQRLGICPLHRRSFAPVRRLLAVTEQRAPQVG